MAFKPLAASDPPVYAMDYGVKANNSTNDAGALQAAINAAALSSAGAFGSCVELPKGTIRINKQIVLKNKVRLVGVNKRSTILKATAGFPQDTPLVRIGDGSSIVFDSSIEHLAIDCSNIPGSTGVFSTEAQEGSGLSNVLVSDYRGYGINFEAGTSLVDLRHLEVFPSTHGSIAGIRLADTAGVNYIHDVTVNGMAGGIHQTGVDLHSTGCVLTMIHVEDHADGVKCGANTAGTIIGATGHPTTTNLIHTLNTTKDWTFQAIGRNGSLHTLVDDFHVITWTDDYIRSYSQHETIVGQARITSGWNSPEGAVIANPGSLFLSINGSSGKFLYVKESGNGNTGWTGK